VGLPLGDKEQRRDQDRFNIPPADSQPILKRAHVFVRDHQGVALQVQFERIVMEQFNPRARFTSHSGNGPTYIQDPASGVARLKQRRETEQNHKAELHPPSNSTLQPATLYHLGLAGDTNLLLLRHVVGRHEHNKR
jgi:hypothetical protein